MHGSEDDIVPPGALEMIKGRLHPERYQGLLFKNGHTIPLEMMQPLTRHTSNDVEVALIKRRRIRTLPFPPSHRR
jgi:predicted esterase